MPEYEINKIYFKNLTEEWLQYKKTKIKESTYLNYKFTINNKLLVKLGNYNLKELLKYDFNSFVNELMEYLSNKTVKDIVCILKGILRYAEMKYDINFKLGLISTPSLYKKEIEIINEKDRKKLEKYCLQTDELKRLGILISLYSGLRIGEICALKWKNIDFENKNIYVTHTIQRVYIGKNNTKVIYTTPKTQKSIRKVPIAKTLYEKLKPLSKKYTKESFLLTGEEDKWIEPLGYRYTYKIILENCEIEYKKYHILRHTFATRCIKVGMDVKSLSEILGHANVTITLNIYVHSSFETKSKFINRL